ncbi:hypothetical protein FACS1894206_05150 [Deltaproteobacteria bacterium]|nr:hypothetical protein FACS1894206_05150 [Deltaproteobacteria bacterium]
MAGAVCLVPPWAGMADFTLLAEPSFLKPDTAIYKIQARSQMGYGPCAVRICLHIINYMIPFSYNR